MWPLEGYWNEGEVRTLFFLLGHVLAPPMKRFPVAGAQDAKSVGPCSPPSLGRCRGGRITDSRPFIGATGYNGCGSAFAGAASASSTICEVVAMGCARCMQVHTAARALADTFGKERPALPAMTAPRTSCMPT
jgi:hypothetical protein